MGQVGTFAVNPFSKPVRPFDPMTGPDQVRGALNQLAKSLTGHDADASLHVVSSAAVNVAGVATAIVAAPTGQAVAFVSGDDGAGKAFVDLVVWHRSGASAGVMSATTTRGVPAARTYTLSSGALQVALAAGTYAVQAIPLVF